MTISKPDPGGELARWQPLPPESRTGSLLQAIARALGGPNGGEHHPNRAATGDPPPGEGTDRRAERPGDTGTAGRSGTVDADAVAEWAVDRYPDGPFRALVIGSTHGAAGHLAVALGAPWLPTGFEVALPGRGGRRGGDGRRDGDGQGGGDGQRDGDPAAGNRPVAPPAEVAREVLAANPDLAVREVHRPRSVCLVAQWLRLPPAYRRFVADRLAGGAQIVLVRDTNVFGVRTDGERHTYRREPAAARDAQVPDGDQRDWTVSHSEQGVHPGLANDLRRAASEGGYRVRRVLFSRPDTLSAAVADMYRAWLRAVGKTGNRLIVECGRLMDPGHVVRAGLVPYWLPDALRRTVAAVELWIAASQPFAQIEMLIEPPGAPGPEVASLDQCRSVTAFATRRGLVDPGSARAFPTGRLPAGYATEVLGRAPYDLPIPPPLSVEAALTHLGACRGTPGLVVS